MDKKYVPQFVMFHCVIITNKGQIRLFLRWKL